MMNHIKNGTAEADRQIDGYCRTIENMGHAGIRLLGYNFSVLPVVRTNTACAVRGGASSGAFEKSRVDGLTMVDVVPAGAEEIWERYRRFITRVLPVAEAAGVTLALHPDDPPVPTMFGVDRILCTRQDFERALAMRDSAAHKLDFCVGTWAEAGAASMLAALSAFAARGRIAYVHLRNIAESADGFVETFIDEGVVNVARVMWVLRDSGFDGFIIDDHVPHMIGDAGWAYRGRAFSTGYLKGMLKAIEQAPS